jgi:transposase-like protein
MMTQEHSKLSAKSVTVLTMIANGHTYQQILDQHPDLTYPDIFCAAQEALDAMETIPSDYHQRLARIQKAYPRAYQKWTEEEDDALFQLVRSGVNVDEVARRLQRQPSAIHSRMQKLESLVSEPPGNSKPPQDEANLKAKFHEAMLEIYRVAAEHGYYATRFRQLVDNRGGVGAARWLLAKEGVQEGLTKLWELGLLEHSTEAIMLQERFRPLFTESELQEARRRLESLGFTPK